jgi:hypothetical protein
VPEMEACWPSSVGHDLIIRAQALTLEDDLAIAGLKDAAPPAAAHRRTPRVLRPPRQTAPPHHLAIGDGAHHGVREALNTPTTGWLTTPAPPGEQCRQADHHG